MFACSTGECEINIRESFERSPLKSTRRASTELGIPQSTVWHVFRCCLLFNWVHIFESPCILRTLWNTVAFDCCDPFLYFYFLTYSFIHSAVCRTTGPYFLPQWVLRRVWTSASSFDFQYPVFSLRSFNSLSRLLHRLPITSILSSIFPSITCFRRQFLWRCD